MSHFYFGLSTWPFYLFCSIFETGSCFAAQAGFELTFLLLLLLSVGIIGVAHNAWPATGLMNTMEIRRKEGRTLAFCFRSGKLERWARRQSKSAHQNPEVGDNVEPDEYIHR